jgi:hypothetical protein
MTGLGEQRQQRLELLVIVIWFGGILNLLFPNDIGPGGGWSSAALQLYAAIAGMFLSGVFAFASVTEHRFAQGIAEIMKASILILVVGGIAAISVGNGSAAFLMLILTGFSLNWWGTARQ